MSKKTSKVWKFFIEDVNDPTKAICQVSGCGFRASRGKSGGGLGHLTTSGMCQHKQPLVIFLHLSRDPDVILNQNIWSSGID